MRPRYLLCRHRNSGGNMNGRVSKLLRQVFSADAGPDRRREYRNFKRAYTKVAAPKQREVRRMAGKIAEVKSKGGQVKQFTIDEQTHQAIPVEDSA